MFRTQEDGSASASYRISEPKEQKLQRPALSTLSDVPRPWPSFMFLRFVSFERTLHAIWSCNEILTYRARPNIWGARSGVQNNGKVPIYMCNSQTCSHMHPGYIARYSLNYPVYVPLYSIFAL